MTGWTEKDIPHLGGRRALVTGGSGGLGLATAIALARKGAEVLVAGRDPAKCDAAVGAIRSAAPWADVAAAPLDLANLRSVRKLAGQLVDGGRQLDILVNNAGVMAVPRRQETADGFELQFGTNHLGHFALTALLLPALLRARAPRVVTVSSLAHRRGRMVLDDLQSTRRYNPRAAYAQSKLANLVFALELHRRATKAGQPLISIAVHPGLAATDIMTNGPRLGGASWLARLAAFSFDLIAQPVERGALPGLFAATDPRARGGSYTGPNGFQETRGWPCPARLSPAAQDPDTADRLWRLSEQLTGVIWSALDD